ncbi:hypothetical protein PpBr36_05060 [Pyricularia pennisetigena]|uniref:hypothetical protein n=1 Tax=Pyricularia pennisetigena TaxID=1578925 RepID=UPI0011525D9D|nr:hypothetical protein PpBr36_05060 [Pyricularia pennisetigena]TLS26192.1 hypothetical protein PpBr36_05060 [Pyricularia pennisetigena]
MPSWSTSRLNLPRRLGETVSSPSDSNSKACSTGRSRRRNAPEVWSPLKQYRPAASEAPKGSLSVGPVAMQKMSFDRRPSHKFRKGLFNSRFGGGSGSGYNKKRVEKQYHKRSARSSRRSSPDIFAQLSPHNGYLTYHGVNLLNSDVRALKDDWLTDTNIAFWEEYIEHEILPKYPQARVALMRPVLVALMVQAQRLKDIADALPDFRHETHIFLPISDSINAGRRADTGSHWSLLLVSKLDGVAFHYDSLNDHNDAHARAAVDRLSRHLRQPLRFYRIIDMPQQANSSDCGVFVCILMRHLLVKKLLNANAKEKVAMGLSGKQIDAHGGRKEMIKIIEQLRKEGERRRSTGALPMSFRSGNSPPYID